MPRRRYRLLLVAAAITALLLYRAANSSEWDPSAYTRLGSQYPSHFEESNTAAQGANRIPPPPLPGNAKQAPLKDAAGGPGGNGSGSGSGSSSGYAEDHSHGHDHGHMEDGEPAVKLPTLKKEPEDADFALPAKVGGGSNQDVVSPGPGTGVDAPGEGIHAQNPPAKAPGGLGGIEESPTQVHWTKLTEHFPVAEESYILLPSGAPKPIPKVQFDFATESPEAKAKREERQAEIKAEMKRAWGGYREYAWMHDELQPVSKSYRDPFCGWAATLVDGLDTLWIMGMTEEFDEAAHAVENIDFTYSSRRTDIPVFETIIRYLGGLVAAYDVTGGHAGKYKMLLRKAEELAEVLMGVFDTPNRLPILYYQWRPESVSQPHRAQQVSVAELGTMSMEFTRLAQLTGKQKYYDAIARITNAFEELQDKGTALGGIFPEHLDASGCNRTATNLVIAQKQADANAPAPPVEDQPQEYEKSWPPKVPDETNVVKKDGGRIDDSVIPKRPMAVHNTGEPVMPSDAGRQGNASEPAPASPPSGVIKRDVDFPSIFGQNGGFSDWDCVPQGLVSGGWGYESFGMGGSQDSTYEYFPKEYLLLGGLEPKYRKMHEKTVASVKKWLLYRPMIPDERDILFSAKLSTGGKPATDAQYEYEVTHLTCFIGGMFGLGAKIFESAEDLEIAKKLTEGCVWAYGSTPSGIMAEGATLIPCESVESCPWNETLWHAHLDPQGDYRDKQLKEYLEGQAEREKLAEEEAKKAAQEKKLVEDRERLLEKLQNAGNGTAPPHTGGSSAAPPPPTPAGVGVAVEPAKDAASSDDLGPAADADPVKETKKTLYEEEIENAGPPMAASNERETYPRPPPGSSRIHKRLVVSPESHETVTENYADVEKKSTGSESGGAVGGLSGQMDLNYESTEAGKGQMGGQVGQVSFDEQQMMLQEQQRQTELDEAIDPNRPLSHKEYVEKRLRNEKIPGGYVRVPYRRYILRPEAIESVWYMYRITGDPIWMEKGWRMWRAVITAVRTEVGHSAIHDVLDENPRQVDEMESFWLAETLKYFYLLFSTPDTISLDEWVLNTEAHPFRRPTTEVGSQKV